MGKPNFLKSDIGAQAAWKGFSAQTLYIACRLFSDGDEYEYYPEDIEDLVIRSNGAVIEAVQVKNTTANLTLSSLASTKTSRGGDGFFNRMCSLHSIDSSFSNITIVYFSNLGEELQEVENNNEKIKEILAKRLEEKHNLLAEDAIWLINSLKFERASIDELETNLKKQISSYVPAMPAPMLAQDLLVQYISKLSNSKGCTTLKMWQEKIHDIGVSISAIDGFYKEYNKSLVCLSELQLNATEEQLKNEFSQGVSAHPAHIRYGLDIKRDYWLEKIQNGIEKKGVVVIKGVSGQGKSTLCYRYLLDTYPEECVFCVRKIATEPQAQNLVSALDGLGKNNTNLILYIDVQPGETLWAFLIQELQARGLNVPVLISIRDEDYNATPYNGKAIQYDVVELTLSKEEAEHIYNSFTNDKPHSLYRTLEEAWITFGGNGPLMEFVYMLSNNQSLTHRLQAQIDSLIKEQVPDDWIELLQLVCYAGRLGASIDFYAAKKTIQCSTMQAAIQRLKDEYLIRVIDENRIEALHPVRAQVVFDIICEQYCISENDIVFKTISCVASKNIRVILMDYFSHQEYNLDDIYRLSQSVFNDWVGFASVIKTMLWLDAKRYVDCNMEFIQSLIEKRGKGWLCFLPLDLSGIYRSNELIVDGMKNLSMFKEKVELQSAIDEVKNSLSSLSIDYQATDCFIKNITPPSILPKTDEEKTSFGYALFWMGKRNCKVDIMFDPSEIAECICTGELQSSADAIRGLCEHPNLLEMYQLSVEEMINKMILEMNVLNFSIYEDEVVCKFIPPLENEVKLPEKVKYSNQYWRIKMLDILKQMYPQKEYIDIELIGVDILDDLGIEPVDYKLHIHKNNRHDAWVSEINGWIKIRIDYSLRPSSWEQYVAEIDQIRINVNELIQETIKLIDDIYKKGRYTKERWERVEKRLKLFRTHTFFENHLPISAVDPYCLYSEGNVNIHVSEFFTMRQLLSVEKYKNFRKQLNEVYTSLDNFYSQFAEVLLVRVKNQDFAAIKNPRLAMYNLYSAAKALYFFQNEYASLFSKYSSLEKTFEHIEEESLLTLVNVWRHVLDAPLKGQAVAYSAKQRYRKGATIFRDLLSKVPFTIGGTILEAEHHAYIVLDYPMDEGNTLENEYTDLIVKLRNVFQSAMLPSSDRWYCEIQPVELAYIPIILGTYSPTAFSIPFYKLFDSDVSGIAKTMLPCEIESEVKDKLFVGTEISIWITAMQRIQELKLYLKRFHEVIQTETNEKCLRVSELFVEKTKKQIQELWGQFVACKKLVVQLIAEADGQNLEMLDGINTFLGCYEEIMDCINCRGNTEEIVKVIDRLLAAMLLLQPLVLKKSVQLNCSLL